MTEYDQYIFPEGNYNDINTSKGELSEFLEEFQGKVKEFNGLFDGLTKSLYVGNTQTLQKILDNLGESIGIESNKLDTHLESISSFMGEVTDYMDEDQTAQNAAIEKYDAIMSDSAIKEKYNHYDDDGVLLYYDKPKHSEEARAAANEIWFANRCALW